MVSAPTQRDPVSEVAVLNASQMLTSGSNPDYYYLLLHLTRACAKNSYFSLGQQLHCRILKSGFVADGYFSAVLINFYGKFELINDAHNLFVETPEPSLVSWNSLISGYVHSGMFTKALNLFLLMEKSSIRADAYSFTSALSACGRLSLLHLGKSIHSKIVKLGIACSVFVANCLIDMYGKCGAVQESTRAFSEMFEKDTISWNSIIAANAGNGKLEQARSFLQSMPNPDTISYNELINGIAQFGEIEDAVHILFSSMANPNSSSWNSIITGYVNRNRIGEALEFFRRMHLSGIQMDQFTYSSILSGIAKLSAIFWGNLIHCCIVKSGLDGSVVVGTALIDMYSKCGRMKESERVFQSLDRKNIITWNSMISGYALNGDSTKVIQLFQQLVMAKMLMPDSVTFLNILSACLHNHGFTLEAADGYFQSMIKDYKINPTAEHCCSMIKIMAKDGKIDGAEKMIKELGFESCGVVWKALLSASVTRGKIDVAEIAAAKIIELEGDDNEDAFILLMSNLYAAHGRWNEVSRVRLLMKKRKVKKESGNSWIELFLQNSTYH